MSCKGSQTNVMHQVILNNLKRLLHGSNFRTQIQEEETHLREHWLVKKPWHAGRRLQGLSSRRAQTSIGWSFFSRVKAYKYVWMVLFKLPSILLQILPWRKYCFRVLISENAAHLIMNEQSWIACTSAACRGMCRVIKTSNVTVLQKLRCEKEKRVK